MGTFGEGGLFSSSENEKSGGFSFSSLSVWRQWCGYLTLGGGGGAWLFSDISDSSWSSSCCSDVHYLHLGNRHLLHLGPPHLHPTSLEDKEMCHWNSTQISSWTTNHLPSARDSNFKKTCRYSFCLNCKAGISWLKRHYWYTDLVPGESLLVYYQQSMSERFFLWTKTFFASFSSYSLFQGTC